MTAKHATINRMVAVFLFLERATEPMTLREIADECECALETTRDYLNELVAQGGVETLGEPSRGRALRYRWAT